MESKAKFILKPRNNCFRGTIVLVPILIFFIFHVTPALGVTTDTQPTENNTGFTTLKLSLLTDNASPALGSNDAPITLIEFGDYQDYYSNQFYHNTEPDIIQNYIDTGKVRMIFKDFVVIGQDSVNAANAARCAQEKGKFWEYHDALYNNWNGENTGWASSNNLLKLANQIGLDEQQFEQCMSQAKYILSIQSNLSNARDLGLTSTPVFFIIRPNDSITKIIGEQPYHIFENAFESSNETIQQSVHTPTEIQNKVDELISTHKIIINSSDSVNSLIFKGKAFFTYTDFVTTGHYNIEPLKAFYYFDAALKKDPNNTEAQNEKDGVYQNLSVFASNLIDYDNLLAKNPNSVQYLEGKCQVYYEFADYANAIPYCDNALKNSPDDQVAIKIKYNSLLALHKYEDALPLSYKINSYGAPLNVFLKIIPLYNLKKYDDIIKYLDNEIQFNSAKGWSVNVEYLMFGKAVILEKTGQSAESNNIFSSTYLGPRDDVNLAKGSFYLMLKDYQTAIQYLEKSQIQTDDVGYMKVIAYDKIAESDSMSSISSTSSINFLDGITQFFKNLFHW